MVHKEQYQDSEEEEQQQRHSLTVFQLGVGTFLLAYYDEW